MIPEPWRTMVVWFFATVGIVVTILAVFLLVVAGVLRIQAHNRTEHN